MHLIYALVIRLIGPVSFVAMLLLLSRLKGGEVSGVVIAILSWTMVVSTLSRIGFDQLIYQYSKEFKSDKNRISDRVLSNAIFLSLLLCTALVLFSYVLYFYFGFAQVYVDVNPLLLAFVAMAVTTNFIAAACAQSRGDTFRSVMTFPTVFYLLVTVFVLSGLDNLYAIAFAATANLSFSVYFLVANHSLSVRHLSLSYLYRSRFYYVLNLNNLVYDWGASYFIFAVLGAPQMLLFAFGNRIASISSLPFTALNAYLLPLISANHKNSDTGSNKTLSKNVVYLSFVSQVLILSALFVFEDIIAEFSLLDKYELRGVIVPLVIAQLVNVFTGPVGSLLVMSGRAKAVAIINGTMAVTTLIVGTFAAKYVGVSGVAITIACGFMIQNLTYAILAYRWLDIVPVFEVLRDLFKIWQKKR